MIGFHLHAANSDCSVARQADVEHLYGGGISMTFTPSKNSLAWVNICVPPWLPRKWCGVCNSRADGPIVRNDDGRETPNVLAIIWSKGMRRSGAAGTKVLEPIHNIFAASPDEMCKLSPGKRSSIAT